MPSFYRTKTLKIEEQPIFFEANAASANVWNGCCYQMDMYPVAPWLSARS